jgi:hypothetical protein
MWCVRRTADGGGPSQMGGVYDVVDIVFSLQAQARESGHSSPTNHRRHTACSRARCANCRLAWHKRAWGSTWTADVGEPPPHTWTCCLGQSYRAYRSLYDSPATSRCRRVLQAQCAPPGVDELQLRRGESKEGSGRDGIVPLMLQRVRDCMVQMPAI